MSDKNQSGRPLSDDELADLVASTDTGGRNPTGSVGILIAAVAFLWSFYQLLLASPFGLYVLPGDMINNNRQIHLAFGIFLAFMVYPALRSSPRDRVPVLDWILAIAATFTALYGWIFYDKIVSNKGTADDIDKWFAFAGLILLFEASRRALGPAMAAVATIFLLYVFFGSSPLVPDVIRWSGASLEKAMSHMWITTQGVFGTAISVSASFVFLFVLFGTMLDKAGAGNYFIKMAFGALGHLRGGPAKAAVLGSAATGLISGSSISNVVTTGTFTIPLMKRVGFKSEQAGAVEVASSVNGQIMPPVMGAAAFLMVEYVGISYLEVIKAAALPAVISYIALIYIVHLEALKKGMQALPRPAGKPEPHILITILGMLGFFVGFAAMCIFTQYPVRWITGNTAGAVTSIVLMLIVFAAYIALLWLAAQQPDLEPDDPNDEDIVLPDVGKIYTAGLYYLLPIVVLVYFLMIGKKSPALSAYWATILMVVVLLTQRPIKAFFRGEGNFGAATKRGLFEFADAMISGARNMIGIALATAAAGVIVGTVTLTGIGQVMAQLVEYISGGNLVLMLICVGLLSLILGMGLPTTANYIVVSALMAGVVVELGAQSGLIVPLIAVHLFVFYFGIMADVTPPVGLASFAAAAVSGGDAIKTGFIALFYSLRTVVLPFLFIFNTELLLIDVGWFEAAVVAVIATIAILIFTAGTMGYFLTKSNIIESILLIAVAFALFRPGFFLNMVQDPFNDYEPASLVETVQNAGPDQAVRLRVTGQVFETKSIVEKTLLLPPSEETDAEARLRDFGIEIDPQPDGMIALIGPLPNMPVFEDVRDLDFYPTDADPVHITAVRVPADQAPKELIWIPAFLVLGLVVLWQRFRMRKEPKEGPVTA